METKALLLAMSWFATCGIGVCYMRSAAPQRCYEIPAALRATSDFAMMLQYYNSMNFLLQKFYYFATGSPTRVSTVSDESLHDVSVEVGFAKNS